MKIGIITVYHASNFGAYLQAYALKRAMEHMGHDVFHIETKSEKKIRRGYFKYPATRRSFKHPIEEFQKYLYGKKKYDIFKKEQQVFVVIPETEAEHMDRIIIGSDELWNISEEKFRHPLYFGAGLEYVLTYGISIGRAKKKDFLIHPEFLTWIKNIHQILVRDKKTQLFVKESTGKLPPMVCDPTFLIPLKEMIHLCHDPYIKNHSYILVYTYEFIMGNKIKEHIIRYAKEKNLKIVSVGFFFAWCDYNLNCGPLEFSDVIRYAQCMVTTTFHGSIFALLNHQRFLVEPFSPKVNDVLEKVGIPEVAIPSDISYEQFCSRMDQQDLDYQMVDRNVMKMRKESLELLKQYM